MPITPKNIMAHEWIGLQITINASANGGLTGLLGVVRDETRNTLLIEARNRSVRVPKADAQFIATLPTGETVPVEGSRLRNRPEDRVKKGIAKW